VASLLVFIQGAIALSLAFEAVGGAIVFGGAPAAGALLSLTGAIVTMVLARGVRRCRRRARRWVMIFQFGWLVTGTIDTALSLFLAGAGPAPARFLTRFLLPISILWILHRTKPEFLSAEEPDPTEELELEEVPA